jgi:hypothetical protein
MVALFLRTELSATRFRHDLTRLLRRAGRSERVIVDPNLDDTDENRARRQLLIEHRGDWRTGTGMFEGFPSDVRWAWLAITVPELSRVRFINYDYWVELSGGTRPATKTAMRIRAGVAPFGVPTRPADRVHAAPPEPATGTGRAGLNLTKDVRVGPLLRPTGLGKPDDDGGQG